MRAARQHCGAADVDDETADADHEHRARVHVLRRAESPDRLDHDADRAGEQQHTVGLCGKHLGALEAERVAFGRRALRERERHEGETEREHVGGEMERVGDEGEAVEQQAADQLDDEKPRVRRERDEQRAAAGADGGVDDDKSTTRASSIRPAVRRGPPPARTGHRRRCASSRRRAASPWA